MMAAPKATAKTALPKKRSITWTGSQYEFSAGARVRTRSLTSRPSSVDPSSRALLESIGGDVASPPSISPRSIFDPEPVAAPGADLVSADRQAKGKITRDGVFLEAHPNPDKAKSDAANQLPLHQVKPLLTILRDLHAIVS